MNPQSFTHKSQKALEAAYRIAEENGQAQVHPEHMLQSLITQDGGVVPAILKKLQVAELPL